MSYNQPAVNGHGPGVSNQIEMTNIIELLAEIKKRQEADGELLHNLAPIIVGIEEQVRKHQERLDRQAKRLMEIDTFLTKQGLPAAQGQQPAPVRPAVPENQMHQ